MSTRRMAAVLTLVGWLCGMGGGFGQDAGVRELREELRGLERKYESLERESRQVETKLDRIEDEVGSAGMGLLVSGIVCALWAQYTRRSAWAWFFFGLLLAPIALIAMVWKNADGLKSGELRDWTGEGWKG